MDHVANGIYLLVEEGANHLFLGSVSAVEEKPWELGSEADETQGAGKGVTGGWNSPREGQEV